jgi:hypothetical protein
MKPQRRRVLAASAVVVAAVLGGLGAFALSGGLDRTVTEGFMAAVALASCGSRLWRPCRLRRHAGSAGG